jgi:glycine cleavage system H protein
MVVILVVLTFALFITLDIVRERKRATILLREGEALHHEISESEPHWVAGFKLPQSLSYHPGHTWVHWVSPDEAYVGLDDFARRLSGKDTKVCPPPMGTVVSQGEPAIAVQRNGEKAELLSPIGGEIVGVNPRLKEDPGLAFKDSYGLGWIYKIKSPSLFKQLANLLRGSLAERWMEDTRERFQYRLMLASGSVIQDGGVPVEDIASSLKPDEWRALVDEFLTRSSNS